MKVMDRMGGRKKYQFEIFGAVAIGLFSFGITSFVASSFFSPRDSHAETDISTVIENEGGYTLSATSSQDTVQMNVAVAPGGVMGVAKDTINVKSNAPNGYKIFVSMDDASSNALNKDTTGETTPVTASIDATSGTFAIPAVLDLNSWGFAIANGTTGAPVNSFSPAYNPEVPDKTTKWAEMPVKGEEQVLQTITEPDNTTGIDLDVYYGVNADVTKPSGVYKGTVTYTAVAMTNTGAAEIASISPNKTKKINGGEAMTISTLYTFPASEAQDSSNLITVTIGGKACTGTGADGAIATADLSNNSDGYLVISCTAPANNSGKYDVNINIPKYDKDIIISNALQYWVDTAQASNLCESLSFDPTTMKVNAASAYYGQANCDLSDISGLDIYEDQWDDTKTAAENTADAGLTWNSDNSVLTIEEGYHTEQQVNSQSSGSVTLVDLGTGTSFNVSSYPGYQNFTTNNFFVSTITSVSGSAGNGLYYSGSDSHISGSYSGSSSTGLVKSYNASTGIMSMYINLSGSASGHCSYSGSQSSNYSQTGTVHAYLVY